MTVRRKRRTRLEIARILQLYRDSNLSQREFARRHRISAATFNNWLRQDEEKGDGHAKKRGSQAGRSPRLLPVPPPLVSFQPADFELVLADGRQLRIPADFSPQALGSLLKVLVAC